MTSVLPSTVEEINYLQSHSMYTKPEINNKGFENIPTTGYKREVSLPDGVNWNVFDFESYLNFEDNNTPGNNFKVIESHDDGIVPGEGELRQRSESFSSVASSMEDRNIVYHNLGVKTFNTVCMDSGSTCISSEHSYISSSPVFKELDDEETYQNLSGYLKQGPEIHPTDSLSSISPVSSPSNDSSNMEYSALNNFSVISNCSLNSFSEISVGSKRLADSSDDDLFLMTSAKRTCESPSGSRYHEIRKKNNVASKNCRKTRKEKQKEMELRVAELEKEREQLNSSIEMLEKAIKAHHLHLCTILNNRQSNL